MRRSLPTLKDITRLNLEESLGNDMGESGVAHEDVHDSELGMSNMMVFSDIGDEEIGEDGYQPGRFHLIGLGVYIQLFTFRSIYFPGRLRHAGTSPLAPRGEEAAKWACRCVIISYPSSAYLKGTIRQAFAALPFGGDLLYLSPEMTGVM